MNARDCLAGVATTALLIRPWYSPARQARTIVSSAWAPTPRSRPPVSGVQARGVGLKTSGIWGEGDVVSQIANRQYFFNVLFACSPT